MYCVLAVLCVVSLIGPGLGFHGFPPPSFQSDWLEMSSEDNTTSYRTIAHGLGEVPVMVKVFVRVVGGPNKDYVFEATGAAQTDDDLPALRSGIVYLYSNSHIFIWAATTNGHFPNCFSMYIGEPWGSGENAQKEKAALVQAQAWSETDFYATDFVSEAVVIKNHSYMEIHHKFGAIPALIKVVGPFTTNGLTYYFEGSGSQQGKSRGVYWSSVNRKDHTGGIIFAYNGTTTRIWSRYNFIFTTRDGWGHSMKNFAITQANVRVFAWRTLPCLSPVLDSDWFTVQQDVQTFYELNFPQCNSVRNAQVQLMTIEGNNNGYIFEGTGMAQSGGGHGTFGGVVFAHSLDSIRLWIANSSVASAKLIFVGDVDQKNNTQASNVGQIRVRVWCGNASGTPVCPKDRPLPGCPRMNRVNGITANSFFIKLSSETSRSFLTCARKCCYIRHCAAFSRTGEVCNLYGERQFGNVSQTEDGEELFQLVYEGQSLCGGG